MAELHTLEKGKDWTASAASVTGKGTAGAELKGLQADLNRFADVTSSKGVAVDGQVGAQTVAAVKAVYDAVLAKNPLLSATPFPIPDTKEEVATYAPHIRQWLSTTAANALGVPQHHRFEFGDGKEWNIKGAIAYGAGPVHEEFKALQADLNRFAPIAGFPALEPDGFIGPKTATAVSVIYKQVIARNPLLSATPFPVPDTKEEVAEWAEYIHAWLRETAGKAIGVTNVS